MECEDSDTGSDAEDDEVFVERVAFSEYGDVEEHDGEKFTGFCEDKGYVVDVS